MKSQFLTLINVALIGLAVSTPTLVSAKSREELNLPAPLRHQLEQVLKSGDSLRGSLVAQNEERAEIGIREVLKDLEHARASTQSVKPHEREHLMKILNAAHSYFEMSQSAYGDDRRERMQEGFNQLANLVRIYHVDKSYGIFFCPKDRSTWVQRGTRAQNPFPHDGGREPCGLKVPD